MTDCHLILDIRCTLGEGIVWDARRAALWWTDIEQSVLWRRDHATGEARKWALPDRLGSLAVCESGRLLLALASSLKLGTIDEASGQLSLTALADVERDLASTRSNDGRTDRAGNFVFGTMSESDGHPAEGSFYQFSVRRGLRRLNLDRVGIPNSICFSIDGRTMYFCDSVQRRIMQGDYDADAASVANVRPFVSFTGEQGMPDGSIIDADGCLWNAEWGKGVVRRYRPDGSLERSLTVPAPNPTCLAFAGPSLDELYVTSARQEMSAEELARVPHAGALYRVMPGVTGVVDAPFADEGLA